MLNDHSYVLLLRNSKGIFPNFECSRKNRSYTFLGPQSPIYVCINVLRKLRTCTVNVLDQPPCFFSVHMNAFVASRFML
uniref:Uncharacterized protein n=1 Tax=Aegilops tauschii subsp. strangulata TaxID=200361 RepID=A0A453P0Q8_AEGTS